MAETVPQANRHVRGIAIVAIILLLPCAQFLSTQAHHLDFAEAVRPGLFVLTVALLLWTGYLVLGVLARNARWRWVGFARKPLLAAVVLNAAFLIPAGISEGYCYLWPAIDTAYAPGCTERKFDQITVGMTKAEVIARIGQPLYTSQPRQNPPRPTYREKWSYTQDGAAPIGDWAWRLRELVFVEGRVVEKVRETLHN